MNLQVGAYGGAHVVNANRVRGARRTGSTERSTADTGYGAGSGCGTLSPADMLGDCSAWRSVHELG